MVHLAAAGISHSYGDLAVLSDIDLAVEKGAFVSLLGPSGCGKTTMLRIIAGFVEPVRGTISIAGHALNGVPPHKRNIGVVFQSYALFPHMSAAGNVDFGLKMRDLPKAERNERIARALALVGLGHLGERYPAQLSGGQQQRVALARALVIEPDVLLLDEPLSNLDAGLRAEMREEITKLRDTLGVTTLFVTHDQSEALAMSDQVVVMNHGVIVESGPPEALSEHPRHPFTARFLGSRTVLAGKVEMGAAGKAFRADGGPLVPLTDEPPPDDATHMVLRASRLRLGEEAAPGVACTIVRSTFLGDQHQLTVDLGGPHVVLFVPSEVDVPKSGPARLTAPPGSVTFLSETTTLSRNTPS
ncbi:MAG: ABC transporter ATP-binding protein [Pseudomonadota bacterium]